MKDKSKGTQQKKVLRAAPPKTATPSKPSKEHVSSSKGQTPANKGQVAAKDNRGWDGSVVIKEDVFGNKWASS